MDSRVSFRNRLESIMRHNLDMWPLPRKGNTSYSSLDNKVLHILDNSFCHSLGNKICHSLEN